MKKLIILVAFCAIIFGSKAQTVQLDSLARSYFTQRQIDTMSQAFIKSQNYIIRKSWNIYRRCDKSRDTIVTYNRDTIDIRPYLTQRKESDETYIYNVYHGLVIVLDSKDAIKYEITEIYSEQ
jgi:hypothetical protein